VHGVSVSTALVLANERLRDHFEVTHIDTSDHRTGQNVGRWDFVNVTVGVRALATLIRHLRGRRGVVYVPLSQNAPAFLRDSFFIHAAHVRGWKVAGHLRGSDFRSFHDASPRLLRRWIRFTLYHMGSVAVMGSSLRWVFEGLIPADRISVVPNGTPEPAALSLGEPDRVLFLSNLRRRKGVVEALQAALIVVARRPSARFTFAGAWEDDDLERELRARAEPANEAIEFRPTVLGREKDSLLAAATVLLFPPVEPEGHPRVVLEALAAGVPVVTTDRGAIRETVTDGENGFVLDDPDPRELAACVLTLLDDAELCARFSRAAREAYLEHFTQSQADLVLCLWLAAVE
jgi:glycosyltransferase involved in cell wall biosynthesis